MCFLTNSKYSYRTEYIYNLALKKIVNYEKSPNIYDSCEIFQFHDEKSHKSYLEAKRGKPTPPLLEAYFEAVAELYVTKTHDSKLSNLVEMEYYHVP